MKKKEENNIKLVGANFPRARKFQNIDVLRGACVVKSFAKVDEESVKECKVAYTLNLAWVFQWIDISEFLSSASTWEIQKLSMLTVTEGKEASYYCYTPIAGTIYTWIIPNLVLNDI